MAKATKKTTETGDDGDVTVAFTDKVTHDGEEYGPGDTAPMPAAAAKALAAAGAAKITGKPPAAAAPAG